MKNIWRQWMNRVLRAGSPRRSLRIARPNVIECLEVRTLLAAPVVIDGSGSPNEDKAFPGSVATLAIDADGDTLTFTAVSQPTQGTLNFAAAGTFTYIPNAGYTGPDSFTFRANDGNADSNVATFKLDIKPNVAPVATDGAGTPNQNMVFNDTVVPLVTDSNTDKLLYAAVDPPTHGTLNLAPAGTFTYTPAPDYVGPDSFTFKATDGIAFSNVATFNLEVQSVVAPVAIDGAGSANQNLAFNGTVVPLVTDANGDNLTYATVDAPTHGILSLLATGTFTYSPAPNYVGPDSFTFRANDGIADSNVATFNLDVKTVVAPVAVEGIANPDEDTPFPGTLVPLVTDADNGKLTYKIVTQPTHGTLALATAGTFTYTSFLNYSGPDSFTFMANDGVSDSNVATFALVVNPVNDSLKLTLAAGSTQVARNTGIVRIDPSATLGDVDTVVNYSNASIRVSIFNGSSNGDNDHSRVVLGLLSQPPGPDAVHLKGSKIYVNNSKQPVAKYSGGSSGRALTIKFNNSATEAAVNAVLKQIGMRVSKQGVLGVRSLQYVVTAGNQTTAGLSTATVVQ